MCVAQVVECIGALIRSAPKVLQEHWLLLVPPDTASALALRPFAGPSLFTLILHDPSAHVRQAAVVTLGALLPECPIAKWADLGGQKATTTGAGVGIGNNTNGNNSGNGKVRPGSLRTGKTRGYVSLATRFAAITVAMHAGMLVALRQEKKPMVSLSLSFSLSLSI